MNCSNPGIHVQFDQLLPLELLFVPFLKVTSHFTYFRKHIFFMAKELESQRRRNKKVLPPIQAKRDLGQYSEIYLLIKCKTLIRHVKSIWKWDIFCSTEIWYSELGALKITLTNEKNPSNFGPEPIQSYFILFDIEFFINLTYSFLGSLMSSTTMKQQALSVD